MAKLSIYDPFNTRLSTRLNQLFNQLGLTNPRFFDEEDAAALTMRIDVSEDDNNYLVRADLPGVKKDDIHVSIDENKVSISAEIKRQQEDTKDKNVIRSERYEGKIFRNFSLDCKIDENQAEAKFIDGVLELILPKRAGGKTSKQLTIQ